MFSTLVLSLLLGLGLVPASVAASTISAVSALTPLTTLTSLATPTTTLASSERSCCNLLLRVWDSR